MSSFVSLFFSYLYHGKFSNIHQSRMAIGFDFSKMELENFQSLPIFCVYIFHIVDILPVFLTWLLQSMSQTTGDVSLDLRGRTHLNYEGSYVLLSCLPNNMQIVLEL